MDSLFVNPSRSWGAAPEDVSPQHSRGHVWSLWRKLSRQRGNQKWPEDLEMVSTTPPMMWGGTNSIWNLENGGKGSL